MKKKLIIIIFLMLLLVVGTLVFLGQRRESIRELFYSGTIEARQADLAFQINGRVNRVLVDEGHAVKKEDIIAELDQSEFMARRGQARGSLDRSLQTLKQLEALWELNQMAIPAAVERAEAAVKALKSNLAELEGGYRGQEVERARLALDAARLTTEEARKDKERFENLYQKGIVSEKERDVVVLRYETTLKEYERAKEAYGLLMEGFRKESIDAARARLAEGQAAFREAKSNLKKIEAIQKEVEAAKAQVQVARSALDLAEIQLQYTQLKAPFNGVITSRNVEPGEVVSPGREVISLSDLSTVELKIYVDETEIGKVKPGQKVEVRIDTFPQKVYTGHVSFISPEAEFTPKIIQTHKERVKLVYLVKATIPNPVLELKSGMPADAWFR
ncbi:MAG: efflux RND transporter periplasmic adaptor subunit [Pseudomonadota bacterium]